MKLRVKFLQATMDDAQTDKTIPQYFLPDFILQALRNALPIWISVIDK